MFDIGFHRELGADCQSQHYYPIISTLNWSAVVAVARATAATGVTVVAAVADRSSGWGCGHGG